MMPSSRARWIVLSSFIALILASSYVYAQQPAPQTQGQTAAPNPYLMGTDGLNQGPRGVTSYMPVAITETFAQIFARMTAAKAGIEQVHTAVLNERYDLTDRPAQGVTMDRSLAREAGLSEQLLPAVQWHSYPEAARRAPPAADTLSAAAVQRNRGSPLGDTQPGRCLL
jgi:hypothetical protein